jgi:ketosteroid isomerase-like protein
MNRTGIWCLIGLLSLGSTAWSQNKPTGGGTEQAVAGLEQQWLQSQKANNPDLVAPLLADTFVNTSSDGKVGNKAKSLADAKATKYDSVDYDDVKVSAFGNTAIATGDFKAKGTDPSGKPLDVHERFTDT